VRQRKIAKIGIAVTASALMSAGAVSLLNAGGAGPVALPYATVAAINTSNTTVGFADSDIIGMSQTDINRTLDEMQAMGVQNVRILIPWNNVEPANNYFYWNKVDALVNAAYSRDMGILGVLNSTPAWAVAPGRPPVASPPASNAEYAQFVGTVAARYAGKISAYEVWNEPNAATFWNPSPDPAAYTAMLQAAYPAIKAADPNATVIGGVVGWVTDYPNLAISPAKYVQGMYDAGAQGYFDALSYHPYQYQVPFGQGKPYGPAAPINQLDLMHQEIWATEYGEPTSVVSEATQATFISNFLNTWSSVGYTGPSFIYTTRDRNTGSTKDQDTLGVLRTDWTRKPAADVIQQWTATHPQSPPATTTPTVSTTTAVAPMAATEVPQSTLTVSAPTTETTAAPTATATPAATVTATPVATTEPTASTSTGTTSTKTTSTGTTSTGTTSTGTTSTGTTSTGKTSTAKTSTDTTNSSTSTSGSTSSTGTSGTSSSTG
jgi:hypothetical protein